MMRRPMNVPAMLHGLRTMASAGALLGGLALGAFAQEPRPMPPGPEPDTVETLPALPIPRTEPTARIQELSVETLVSQVLTRNPSLAEMTAAWQAARARYPQVTSLEDPTFAATIGPGTIAPDDPGINF